MTTEDFELDWERFKPEAARAIEGAGVMLEQLTPGTLAARKVDDGLELLDSLNGTPVGVIPYYRLRQVDDERMRRCAVVALEKLPEERARELAASINSCDMDIATPPDSEWVSVFVGPDSFALFRAHRSVVVAGWPATPEDVCKNGS